MLRTMNIPAPAELKVFVTGTPEAAEMQVNDWLRENTVTVQYIGQSQSEKNGRFVFVMSVFYTR